MQTIFRYNKNYLYSVLAFLDCKLHLHINISEIISVKNYLKEKLKSCLPALRGAEKGLDVVGLSSAEITCIYFCLLMFIQQI